MASGLAGLCDDELLVVFEHVCSTLDPRPALALSAASRSIREPLKAALVRLRLRHEQAEALLAMVDVEPSMSCAQAGAATELLFQTDLTVAEWDVLGALVDELPQLSTLLAGGSTPSSRVGVQRFLSGLGAGALPALEFLNLSVSDMDEAGAASLAAALGRGAIPRLSDLLLECNPIKDAGLVALAPQLRQRPLIADLRLEGCQIGDDGLAALVAPPFSTAFKTLIFLDLKHNQISDAGCAKLAEAIRGGALAALQHIDVSANPAISADAFNDLRHAVKCLFIECLFIEQ